MQSGAIISVQSFRGGTGKSNIAANLAALGARAGRRIAVLDTDFQSPGTNLIFDLQPDQIRSTFIDYLHDKCTILETAYDMTRRVHDGEGEGDGEGRCWVIPGSLTEHAITQIIHDGYDIGSLGEEFNRLVEELRLDYLIIDTHPGLNRETMLTTALSNALLLILRPDQQDYLGTALFLEVARKLEVEQVHLVMNKLYSHIDADALRGRVERAFGCEVLGMLPLSEDFARLESRTLFCRAHPAHEITRALDAIARRLFVDHSERSRASETRGER